MYSMGLGFSYTRFEYEKHYLIPPIDCVAEILITHKASTRLEVPLLAPTMSISNSEHEEQLCMMNVNNTYHTL